MPGREGKIHREIILAYSAVSLIFLLDQISKQIIVTLFQQGRSIPVIKNIFHLTLVYNTGAAFGILKAHSWLFVVISFLAIIVINYFLLMKYDILRLREKTALCFILAGTLGNLVDRLRLGYVVDFIDFRVWPVFNLADSFITVGVVILGWSILMGIRRSSA
ncbi:signal peptidase II [Candidatus Omnitrophota bacterium]